MATPFNSINQNLFNRMRSDNIFGGGVQRDIGNSMSGTFGALRAPLSPPPMAPTPNVMQAGIPQPAPISGPTALNLATGNIFGGRLPVGVRNAAIQTSPAVQTAGVLAGMQDQIPIVAFRQRLMDAGINLNPDTQYPGDYQRNVAAAQGIYNSMLGGASANNTPIQAFAPTGLRERALAAKGAPVWGQGDVMAMSQGTNAQGGQRFALGQWMPAGGPNDVPSTPQNPYFPIAPSPQAPAAPPAVETPFQKNAKAFQDHIIAQQTAAGLSKGLEPGYMIDPDRPNAVKPIPGSKAELEYNNAKQAASDAQNKAHLAAQQGLESVTQAIKTIDQALPTLSVFNTGPAQQLTGAIAGTPAFQLRELTKPLQSKLTITQLQDIRAAAKNGASGFGQLSDKEGELLGNSIVNINNAQNAKQLADAYKDAKTHFLRLRATYKMGLIDPETRTPGDIENQNAVKWALDNPGDPRSEKILEANQ